jgi:hypothetical protein
MTATYDPRPDWSREDAERAVEAARPQLETAVELPHEVWGWLDEHTHASVTELETCEAYGQDVLDRQAADELAAELGYERWLESQGYCVEEDLEALRGIGVDVEWSLAD